VSSTWHQEWARVAALAEVALRPKMLLKKLMPTEAAVDADEAD
jgi:hypothetical protein